MQTRYFSIQGDDARPQNLSDAAEILRSGGIVAFPTETVYGLGARADNEDAIARLYELKSRPSSLPLTLHLPDAALLSTVCGEVPAIARRLIDRYWPGPLTLVLPQSSGDSIGVRVPSHDSCREFLRQARVRVVATSANLHGQAPATESEQVREFFDSRIDAVLDGGPTVLQQSSTVIRIDDSGYEVLREGIITPQMVHQLLVGKDILFVCTGNSCRSPMAAALFRKRVAEKLGVPVEDLPELGYTVHSAGLFAEYGNSASAHAVTVMEEMGCDVSDHSTRPMAEELVNKADQIYTLGTSHYELALQLFPHCRNKLNMLSENGILDPIGGDLETYRRCARDIDSELVKILERLPI